MWFNEIEPFAAEWLRNLFPAADVDERSIRDLGANDAVGRRCHFFAGIGGWELALQLAGWPDEREVWTGSCPCQPFSDAGKKKGVNDERHLWPEFRRLIAERRPATVLGEQVASELGREWLAGVRADLEALGYAVGSADLCAAGAGSPNIRQRLWWVADSDGRFAGDRDLQRSGQHRQRTQDAGDCGLGDSTGDGRQQRRSESDRRSVDAASSIRLGDPDDSRPQRRIECRDSASQWITGTASLVCLDGRSRRIPTEPRFQPLAHGVPARVGRLRAYGNAIVPQVAAVFVRSFMESALKEPTS